jgi:mannonate dehydratase
MHPDDPPISPFRGIGRIMRGIENFQRLIELAPGPTNSITFCQGNFALMTDDLPAAIRHSGEQSKIFFVHFRDVRGTPERFVECFHDDGSTDMLASRRASKDIDLEGVLRPDHVPTNDGWRTQRRPRLRGARPALRDRLHPRLAEAMYGKRTT